MGEAVLTSAQNLCFGTIIRKVVYPCVSQFYYMKVGYKGLFISWICFLDAYMTTGHKDKSVNNKIELCHEKTNSLHCDQCICFCCMDSTIPLLSQSKKASSHLLCLCSSVCISRDGSNIVFYL